MRSGGGRWGIEGGEVEQELTGGGAVEYQKPNNLLQKFTC